MHIVHGPPKMVRANCHSTLGVHSWNGTVGNW